jgi:hypothetical protein
MEPFDFQISLTNSEIEIIKKFSKFYEDIKSDSADDREALYKLFKWGVIILDEETNTFSLSESGKLIWVMLKKRTEELEKVQAEKYIRKRQLEEFGK